MKEIRDKKIDLRLTAEEKESIKDAADRLGMTASEFIRFACAKYYAREEE